jgi:hypothetical protein
VIRRRYCAASVPHGIYQDRGYIDRRTAVGVEEAKMTGIMARGAVTALLGILICGPAAAQKQDRAPAAVPDPNEIVCQKQEVTGSRLQSKRVCRTRAEWAEMQRLDRQELDKTTSQRYMKGF